MRDSPTHPLSLLLLLGGLVALSACDRPEPVALEPTALEVGSAMYDATDADLDADLRQQIAALRRMTAPFHRIEVAMAAGWDTPLTPCLADPTEGAMGIHYGNVPFLIDPVPALLEPETLLYEPRKNGDMRLVGVEYVIPFDLVPETADPPELLGQEFHPNTDAGVWGLHVWLWRHNPEGIFADWNAKVTCDWAS